MGGWPNEGMADRVLCQATGRIFHRRKSIARFRQHEEPRNRFCESSHQEDRLTTSCVFWVHNKIFAATSHQWEIAHLKWHPGLSAARSHTAA